MLVVSTGIQLQPQAQSFILPVGGSSASALLTAVRSMVRYVTSLRFSKRRINQARACNNKIEKSAIHPLLSNVPNSYVSTATFFENKHGFPESLLLTNDCNLNKTRHCIPMVMNAALFFRCWDNTKPMMRGFKTIRSGHGGDIRSNTSDKSSAIKQFIKEPLRELKFDSKTNPKQNERVKKFISNGHSPEMTEKIKLAFAEGYLANEKKDVADMNVSRTTLFTRITRAIMYVVGFWVAVQLFQLFGSMSGGMRGLGMLNRDNFEANPEEITVAFADVRGVDEAKQELQDIVNYLQEPDKYTILGAKLPKGVLLVGPPGTGKTLLARAVAGEAGVPFFHASGSEFDEIFVGTGAKRVRQLFSAAKARAPCVVFIDEIDTVGAKRTSSQIHPYANQTINQLLSEMDGFHQTEGVIVLGATNRRDNLDQALLRPGRFDVEVRVFPPDLKGRKDILELYLRKVKTDNNIDIDKLGRGTTGFTGADLENMVNQAALRAAMDSCECVNMNHLEYARDKVLMGPEKKNRIADAETNWLTAYHEAGHTLVAYYTKDAIPLHKVTIIPRGMSLGHTSFVPAKEQYGKTKAQLLAEMDVAMGGRVAEEIMYGAERVTTGASSDFQQATMIATAMVKKYGMSEKVGVRVFDDSEAFDSGLSLLKVNEVGPSTTEMVDNEIRRFLQESYERARNILRNHSVEHKALAKALMHLETLNSEEIKHIIEGKKIL